MKIYKGVYNIVIKRCYNDKIVLQRYSDNMELMDINVIKALDYPGAWMPWAKKPIEAVLADSKNRDYDEIIYLVED